MKEALSLSRMNIPRSKELEKAFYRRYGKKVVIQKEVTKEYSKVVFISINKYLIYEDHTGGLTREVILYEPEGRQTEFDRFLDAEVKVSDLIAGEIDG